MKKILLFISLLISTQANAQLFGSMWNPLNPMGFAAQQRDEQDRKEREAEERHDCFIIGDSIAQGIAINSFCKSDTKVGLNTSVAKIRYSLGIENHYRYVISLGINDSNNLNLIMNNLEQIRQKIDSQNVTWILPNSKYLIQRMAVVNLARDHNDETIDTNGLIGDDNIHPTSNGYKVLAKKLDVLKGI